MTVTALPDTNSLMVSATAAGMEKVAKLLEQLDRPEVSQPVEVRIFPLKNTEPTKIMPLVQSALVPVRQARPDEPISIQADERTKSLVVTARGPMFEQIEQIITTLDKAAGTRGHRGPDLATQAGRCHPLGDRPDGHAAAQRHRPGHARGRRPAAADPPPSDPRRPGRPEGAGTGPHEAHQDRGRSERPPVRRAPTPSSSPPRPTT